MKGARQTEIETRVIDQNHGLRFGLRDLAQCLSKFAPEVSVVFHHFPEANDARFVAPIEEPIARHCLHLRTASA